MVGRAHLQMGRRRQSLLSGWADFSRPTVHSPQGETVENHRQRHLFRHRDHREPPPSFSSRTQCPTIYRNPPTLLSRRRIQAACVRRNAGPRSSSDHHRRFARSHETNSRRLLLPPVVCARCMAAGYADHVVVSREAFESRRSYIHLNPVRARIVEQAHLYPYSSAFLGQNGETMQHHIR